MDGISHISGAPIRESVAPDVKARYDAILTEIQRIMNMKPPGPADAQLFKNLLTELKVMHDKGLTGSMDNFLDVLFAFAEAAGANPSQNNFYLTPEQIQGMGQAKITIAVPRKNARGVPDGTYENQTMTLQEALGVILDPKYDPAATQKLGDMLLQFSKWGYDMYTQQLKDLKQQIDIATAAIRNLQELLAVLNMIKKGEMPPDFNFNPTNWDQIPPDLQNKLKSALPGTVPDSKPPQAMWGPDGKPTPSGMNYITNWTKDNPSTYANWASDYFKKELAITPDIPDAKSAAAKLLAARDQLMKQLEDMKKAGGSTLDTKPGSPYDTIKNVLDDIDKKFPAPPYTKPTQDQLDGKVPFKDWYATNAFGGTDPTEPLKKYIIEGNGTNNAISDKIDKSIQANQNLSSKMSDEIKAKNLTLQTFFDILTQVQDNLNKMLTSMAQKGAR